MTTLTELLDRATSRHAAHPSDGKSTSTFERVEIDGERYFLKRLGWASDWITRCTGDRVHRPYRIWEAGVMEQAPACIDHTLVAIEVVGDELSMLMRDVAEHLVPEGDGLLPIAQHRGFIDHLAQLSATFWGWTDTVGGLTTMAERINIFGVENVEREMQADDPPPPIVAADEGWRRLPERAPRLATLAEEVKKDPTIITEPLEAVPVTFLHGDWKAGNLGTHPDGRTILLDWAYPGSGPACWDLCWYIALNRARLPESKEATIAEFRAALERHGIDTAGWYETQLDLCLVAIMATFGWEKALGDDDELRWWEETVLAAADRRGL